MSKGPKREPLDLRLILRLIRELSNADSVHQVYGVALNAVQEILAPDRAFIALSEAGGAAELDFAHLDAEPRPGIVADVCF